MTNENPNNTEEIEEVFENKIIQSFEKSIKSKEERIKQYNNVDKVIIKKKLELLKILTPDEISYIEFALIDAIGYKIEEINQMKKQIEQEKKLTDKNSL